MTVVGIDLGTTNTVVAAVKDGKAAALPDNAGRVLIPSVVSFHPSGNVLVGSEAKVRRKIDASNTIYSVKRLIGRSWDSQEVRLARDRFPFEMREGPGKAAMVVARKETYTLPEISAFVLRKAKLVAEQALGTNVERAVITVPANFNDLQRAATKVAGRVAGLEVIRILNEPTAAALAYGYGRASAERLAVYDFGGGTLDITLLDLSDNVFEVLATAGDTFLGGDDIDRVLCERMADELLAHHRVDARADQRVYELLRSAAEDLKQQLSTKTRASVTVEEVAHQAYGKVLNFDYSLTRSELDQLIVPILEKTFDVCREALGIARLEPDDFSQVLLVGGSTRIPLVRREVERFFRRQPITQLNPDELVAIGAAIQANALSGAERRQSTLPLPPNPARATRPPRARLSTLPFQGSLPAGNKAAIPHRARLETTPGMQPNSPVPLPAPERAQSVVVPPIATQPRSAAQFSETRQGKAKRTTAMGLGGTLPIPSEPTSRPSPAPPPSAPAATAALESVSQEAAQARSALVSTPDQPDELPLVMPPASNAEADADLLDESEFEELETGLLDAFDDEEEETLARARAPEPTSTNEPELRVPAAPETATPTATRRYATPAPNGGLGNTAPLYAPPDASPLGLDLPPPTVPPAPNPAPAPVAPYQTLPTTAPLMRGSQAPMIREVTVQPPLLIDVTPLTLAVETVGGYCDTVIERNSPIPCEKTRQFATVQDGQESVRVRVSQGEATTFSDNTLLGELVLTGLRRGPRGSVKIDVNFALDTSGMLHVNASDVDTGRSVSTRIRLVGLADSAPIEQMQSRHAAHYVS